MEKIVLKIDRTAERELTERAKRMTRPGPPFDVSPLERGVQFLRGVSSRATMALPAFYLFHAAVINTNGACTIEGYAGVVFERYVKFSSLATVALACRKAFDHDANRLTGARFAKTSDTTLEEHAEYWAKHSTRPRQDAYAALYLLRSIFRDCAKTDTALFKTATPLGQRIGLLKQYADRSAAHLSIEDYAVAVLDCAHVVAALTLIGEIIRSFDDSSSLPSYFDSLDEAAFGAAKQLFPATPDFRLFQHIKVEPQARLCWELGAMQGRRMLLEQLPYAIGWY